MPSPVEIRQNEHVGPSRQSSPIALEDLQAKTREPAKENWSQGEFPRYGMTIAGVEEFLTRKFGDHDFHLNVSYELSRNLLFLTYKSRSCRTT